MHVAAFLARALLLAAPALAEDRFHQLITIGGGPGIVGSATPGAAIVAAAGRTPNATTNATWIAKLGNGPIVQWTWRVNLTNVPVPNNVDDLGTPKANFSEDLRSANTQYELIWPSAAAGTNESLNEFLRPTGTNISFHTVQLTLPNGAQFTPYANGSCRSILSDECIQGLNRNAQAGRGLLFRYIDGCEEFFNGTEYTAPGFTLSHANSTNDTAVRNTYLYPGSTFISVSNDPKPATNLSYYDEALHSLNLMTIAYSTPITGSVLTSSDVLCQVLQPQQSAGSSIGIRASPATTALWVAMGASMLAAAYF